MAETNYNDIVNTYEIQPAAALRTRLRQLADRVLGTGISGILDGLRTRSFQRALHIPTAAESASTSSNVWKVPYTCKLRFADFSIIALNSAATLTLDLQVNRASAGYVSVLNAAENIATAISAPARVAPETTSDFITLEKDDLVKVVAAAGSGGAPTGVEALLHLELI